MFKYAKKTAVAASKNSYGNVDSIAERLSFRFSKVGEITFYKTDTSTPHLRSMKHLRPLYPNSLNRAKN